MNAASKISLEIDAHGIIPFARFMELALYCPVYGYYEAEKDTVGRSGDFYTNVSVGSLFGQLLAFQFAGWLDQLPDKDCRLQLAEAGAHNGQLAHDILTWLRANRPALFDRIEYVLIEPSTRRQRWQREMLSDFTSKVIWTENIVGRKINGMIFSNELLDAFPVQRFAWNKEAQCWNEMGVMKDGGKFVWAKLPEPRHGLCPPQIENVLPDDYTIEINLAALQWWRTAAQSLAQGKLLAIDYGLSEEELFSPSRPKGTLRSYAAHQVSDDVLVNPGEQDITAHVNFSAIQKMGEAEGLKTDDFFTQPQFLTRIVEQISKDADAWKWTPERARQLQTLTHPEHLGRAFRVLIQSRNS